MAAANFEEVGKQFVEYYYTQFDQSRHNLAPLYREQSMLTFEQSQHKGTQSIVEKLAALPFKQVRHQVATLDAQPSGDHGGILVLVTGQLLVDEEQKPMSYTQAFQLLPDGQSFYVLNDVFRLVYSAA